MFFLIKIIIFCLCVCLTIQQQLQAPALLLSTYDSVSIVYPKEMGYEKDFLQIIYKITQLNEQQTNETISYRIEDAVYDQTHSAIYFILSIHSLNTKTLAVSNNGCELIRLKQHHTHHNQQTNHVSYVVATNWSRNLIYKNQTVSILSMQINEKKRKLYWLEFNYFTNKWSIVIMKLSGNQETSENNNSFEYFTFTRPTIRFSTDGYSYISIIHDTLDEQQQINAKQFTKKNQIKLQPNKKIPQNELILFITNNQTLNICFLSNLTCRNFFDTEAATTNDEYEINDDYYEDQSTTSSTTTTPAPTTITFGRLMGIQYDHKERTLYLADYGYDRIEKILLEINDDDFIDIKASYIQTLVQSSPGQLPINPIMSVSYDNNIFWTDFEDGLKSTIYKSPCIRSVYRVKNATTLKLIHILARSNNNTQNSNSNQNHNSYRLSSIQKNQFQYPPDYYLYSSLNNENNEFEALVSSSKSIINSVEIIYLFLLLIIKFLI